MATFKINFLVELRPNQYYTHVDADFESHLVNVQWDFSERFRDSPWSILLGNEKYYFDIRDLSYIWDELPDLLRQCAEARESVVLFYFAAQGTDTKLLVEPSSEGNFLISIERDYREHEKKGEQFDNPGLQRIGISRYQFLMEWRSLVDKMIRLLIEHNLIISDDPSIQQYLDLIPTP